MLVGTVNSFILMRNEPQEAKNITRRQVGWGVFTALLLVGALWAYLVHSRGERAVADYKQHLLKAGEKLSIVELLPKPVPFDHNRAGVFREAVAMLYSPSVGLLDTNPPSAMFMISPANAIKAWDQPDVRDSATNSWEEEIEAVNRERE